MNGGSNRLVMWPCVFYPESCGSGQGKKGRKKVCVNKNTSRAGESVHRTGKHRLQSHRTLTDIQRGVTAHRPYVDRMSHEQFLCVITLWKP